MKRLLLLFLTAVAPGLALGQAPSSIAGYTLRTSYENGYDLPTYYLASVDFFANGTFTANLLSQGGFAGPLNYQSPVTGTYTYTQTSPNTATLNLSQALLPTALIFSSGSQGSLVGYPAGSSFSITPTVGASSARALINMSTLISAKQGSPVTFGFVIGGTTPWREILVRAVGPSLSKFGINNFAVNPVYQLNGVPNGVPPAPGEYGYFGLGAGWSATAASSATITAENVRAGAFSLVQGSNDKADIFLLPPGPYTITVNPNNPSGEGTELIEVYDVE